MCRVRKDDGSIEAFDQNKTIASIKKETGCTGKVIDDIVDEVHSTLKTLRIDPVTGPLIRELVNVKFLERGMTDCRKKYARVGMPIYDARRADIGGGKGDNANLGESPETVHKRKADQLSKEQAILMFPDHIAEAHLNGYLHIHDMEYITSRRFCIDESVVIPISNGDYTSILKFSDLRFEGDEIQPSDLYAFTPNGKRKITSITRRRVNADEMLLVKTNLGKSIKVTKKHRVPCFTSDGHSNKKAKDLLEGDILGHLKQDVLFGSPLEELNVVEGFIHAVPLDILETVFVRNVGRIYDLIKHENGLTTKASLARLLNIPSDHVLKGICKIVDFWRIINEYHIVDYRDVVLAGVGIQRTIPAYLTLTPQFMEMLGYFVSDGSYNLNEIDHHYNLVMSRDSKAEYFKSYFESLGSYATIGIGSWGARQVYWGGKMWYLIFKYLLKIPAYAQNKRIPWIVFNTTPDLRKAFLSGLFSSDGTVYYTPDESSCIVNYTTTSDALRQEILLLLTSLGVYCSSHCVKKYEHDIGDNPTYRINVCGYNTIKQFNEVCNFVNGRQHHVDTFLERVSPIKRSQKEGHVTKIQPIQPTSDWVYDISLEYSPNDIDHCFYAGDGILIHNCADYDLRFIFYYGFVGDGVGVHTSSAAPAKNPEVAILHAVKTLCSGQTQKSGGQGFYNFLTFIAPYFKDCDYTKIKQNMQMFIYEMSQNLVARGSQVCFSSVQLSPSVPEMWKDKPAVFKGKIGPETYGQFEREVRLLFKAFMEVMIDGDASHKPFYFPKPEIAFEPEFITLMEREDIDPTPLQYPSIRELYLLAFKLAAKFGTPYFDNMIPQYRGAGKGISCVQCIPEDEYVVKETPLGIKIDKIKRLLPDERIYSHGPTKFSNILCKFVDEDILHIKCESGRQFSCTKDHSLRVLHEDGSIEVRAEEVGVGDKLFVDNTLPKDNLKFIAFFRGFVKSDNPVTQEEIGYLLGAIAAEGNIHIRPSKTGGTRLQISLGHTPQEVQFAETLKDILERCGYTVKLQHPRVWETRLVIYSRDMCIYLRDWRVPEKTRRKGFVPDFIFCASEEVKFAFLHGYYRGDGSFHIQRGKYPGLSIHTGSKHLQLGVIMLFNSLGLRATGYDLNNRDMYTIDLKRVEDVGKFFSCQSSPDTTGWLPVTEITKEHYVGNVYDPVDVEENHEFRLGNGIIVGNCCSYNFSSGPDADPDFDNKLYFKDGKHFTMGSNQVITLNMPRYAFESGGDYDELVRISKQYIDLALEVFEIKLGWVNECDKNGMYPFATQRHKDPNTKRLSPPLLDYSDYADTLGIIGINEVCEIMLGKTIYEDKAATLFAMRLCNDLNKYCNELSKEKGVKLALSRTPAETTAQRFAVLDLLSYGDAHKHVKGSVREAIRIYADTGSRDLPIYYTNGTHCPVDADISLIDKIKIEQGFFPLLSGGNICNLYLGEKEPDPKGLMDFTLNICKTTNLGYFAFTKEITVCNDGYTEYIP